MSKTIEIDPAIVALANLEARALACLSRYEARPLRSTRNALHAYRELLLDLGADAVAVEISNALWFSRKAA